VIEVVMSAPEPAQHRVFLEQLTGHAAELAPGQLTVGKAEDCITVLDRSETARRFPGSAAHDVPRFCAARLMVGDLDTTQWELKRNGVDFRIIDGVVLVSPAAVHGLALEFVEQGAI